MANRYRIDRITPVAVVLAAVVLLAACQVGCKSKSAPPATKPAAPAEPVVKADGSPPKLSLSTRFIDADVMQPGDTRDFTVNVRNLGGSELIIHRAVAPCKCLQATLTRKKLAPGESTTMAVKVSTLKKLGLVKEYLAVSSNDPAGVQILTGQFFVPRPLAAKPERLHLGVVAPGAKVSRRVEIVANKPVDTKILYAISSSQALVGKVIQPEVSADRPAVMEVVFKTPKRPGTYRHALNITTGHAAQSSLKLPVTVCVSATAVSPAQLDFDRFAASDSISRTLNVKLPAGTTIKTAAIQPKSLDKCAKIKIGKADAKGVTPVTVTFTGAPFGRLVGQLGLQLTGQEESALAIPITGYVTE